MKNNILIYSILISFMWFPSCKDNTEIDKIVEQQTLIETLKNENLNLKNEIKRMKSEIEKSNQSSLTSPSNKIFDEKKDTGDLEQAKFAIQNYMEMYHSGVEYDNLKAVNKTDGTVDIIFDRIVRKSSGEIWLRHKKYFNVSTYSDDTYKINHDWGIVL